MPEPARKSSISAAKSVLRQIEQQGERSFIPVIGPKKGKVLDDAVRKTRPKRALEIGTLIGYSAIRISRLLPKEGKLISIEIDPEAAKEARRNIGRAGLSDRVQVLVGDAKKAIPRLEGSFDLVFIDAEKEEYLTYLKLVERKLHKGSVVVADNAGIFAERMKDYLSYVRHSGKYSSKYYESTLEFDADVKDGVEVSVKL